MFLKLDAAQGSSHSTSPRVRSLVGVNTADGMIDAFNAKIGVLLRPEEASLAAVCVLLEDAGDVKVQGAAAALVSGRGESESIPYRFELIIFHLTLHHIPSLPAILATMFQCLKFGGWIALTDFEKFGPDAVIFHPKSKREGVERHGIKRNEMEIMINGTSFDQVKVETAFTFTKEVKDEDGGPKKEMSIPFLICMGRKA